MSEANHPTPDDRILKAARSNGERPAGSGPCGVEAGDNYNSPRTLIARGLSKRELFAAMAMQGLAPAYAQGGDFMETHVAEGAVKLADALLKELAK